MVAPCGSAIKNAPSKYMDEARVGLGINFLTSEPSHFNVWAYLELRVSQESFLVILGKSPFQSTRIVDFSPSIFSKLLSMSMWGLFIMGHSL